MNDRITLKVGDLEISPEFLTHLLPLLDGATIIEAGGTIIDCTRMSVEGAHTIQFRRRQAPPASDQVHQRPTVTS